MANIIQISGKKRHGKDTVALMLSEAFPNSKILSFAEPMKRILATVLNMSLEELDAKKNVDNEYRVYLQRLGNEAMKPIFGDDVWYKLMLDKIRTYPSDTIIIIPDWRFIVEAMPDSYKIRVTRPSIPVGHDIHASELELDTYEGFTYTLINPEGAFELKSAVTPLVEDIKAFFSIQEPEPIPAV